MYLAVRATKAPPMGFKAIRAALSSLYPSVTSGVFDAVPMEPDASSGTPCSAGHDTIIRFYNDRFLPLAGDFARAELRGGAAAAAAAAAAPLQPAEAAVPQAAVPLPSAAVALGGSNAGDENLPDAAVKGKKDNTARPERLPFRDVSNAKLAAAGGADAKKSTAKKGIAAGPSKGLVSPEMICNVFNAPAAGKCTAKVPAASAEGVKKVAAAVKCMR